MSSEKLASIMKEAMTARKEGKIVLVAQMNKNKKFQKEQLGKEGYREFKEFYKEDLKALRPGKGQLYLSREDSHLF